MDWGSGLHLSKAVMTPLPPNAQLRQASRGLVAGPHPAPQPARRSWQQQHPWQRDAHVGTVGSRGFELGRRGLKPGLVCFLACVALGVMIKSEAHHGEPISIRLIYGRINSYVAWDILSKNMRSLPEKL